MSGRKRGWSATAQAMGGRSSPHAHGQCEDKSSPGDAIENDMKRLRLAYDYDGAHARWMADSAMDTPMQDVEQPSGSEVARNTTPRSAYTQVNAMLKEFHFLRQLRKFQSERVRERASYFERHAAASTDVPRAAAPRGAAFLHDPRA